MIWKRQTTLEQLNRLGEGNMVGLLDIRFEMFTDDTLWRGFSAVAGSWIGGAANQAAMKELFGVSDDLFGMMILVDTTNASL